MRQLFIAAFLASGVCAEDVTVTQYDGPTECSQEDMVWVGTYVEMHYTGTIDASSKTGVPGQQFDSSIGRGAFKTKIGVGQVIKGWDEGLLRLCKGAKATLVVPPEMGYGDRGAGGAIPGGATLHFDVQVLSVSDKAPPPPPERNIFAEIDTDQDGKATPEELLAHFQKMGRDKLPDGLMEHEDKDKDGFVSWEEFGGPKGEKPPGKDEL